MGLWKVKYNKSYCSYCKSAVFLEYCSSYCHKPLFNFQTYQKFYFDFSQCSLLLWSSRFSECLTPTFQNYFPFYFYPIYIIFESEFHILKKKNKFLIECNGPFFTSLLSYNYWMVHSKFTELFNHHYNWILEHFHHPRDCSQLLFLLPTQRATNLLPIRMDLPIPDISPINESYIIIISYNIWPSLT